MAIKPQEKKNLTGKISQGDQDEYPESKSHSAQV
jgi:hypothetical protein